MGFNSSRPIYLIVARKRIDQNWVQHLSPGPFGLLGNQKGDNWHSPTLSRFSGSGTAHASAWFDLSGIFQIVWLRSTVRGRLILNASGTIFLLIDIIFYRIYRFLQHHDSTFSLFLSSSWCFFLFRIYGIWEIRSSSPDDPWGETYRGHLQTLGSQLCRRYQTSWWWWNSGDFRPGYCGAYMSHVEDGGLSFPLPRFLLEALAELGMAFAQMAHKCFELGRKVSSLALRS